MAKELLLAETIGKIHFITVENSKKKQTATSTMGNEDVMDALVPPKDKQEEEDDPTQESCDSRVRASQTPQGISYINRK